MVGKLTASAMSGATGNGRGVGTNGAGEYYQTFVATGRGRGNPTISVKRVRNRSTLPAYPGLQGVSVCAPRS